MVYNTMHMVRFILVFKRTEQKRKTKKDRKREKEKETTKQNNRSTAIHT